MLRRDGWRVTGDDVRDEAAAATEEARLVAILTQGALVSRLLRKMKAEGADMLYVCDQRTWGRGQGKGQDSVKKALLDKQRECAGCGSRRLITRQCNATMRLFSDDCQNSAEARKCLSGGMSSDASATPSQHTSKGTWTTYSRLGDSCWFLVVTKVLQCGFNGSRASNRRGSSTKRR